MSGPGERSQKQKHTPTGRHGANRQRWCNTVPHSNAFFGRLLAAATLSLALPHAAAAGTAPRLLSQVSVAEHGDCAVVQITFGSQVQYLSHYPLGGSDQLRVLLHPLDPAFTGRDQPPGTEILAAPTSQVAAIRSIGLDIEGSGAALNISFTHQVAYKVTPGAGFNSLTIAIPGKAAGEDCKPEAVAVTDAEHQPIVAAPAQSAPASPAVDDPAKVIAAARAAVTAGHFEDAIRQLTKLLEQPKGPKGKEGRELLGLAREKNGQLAHAEAEYRQFLIDFPGGADAARVQQRLDGVIALENKPFEDMHKAAEDRQRQVDEMAVAQARQASIAAAAQASVPPAAESSPQAGAKGTTQLVGTATGASTAVKSGWLRTYDGSVGVYYLRNQGATEILDPINPGSTTSLSQVYQDTITTQLNLRGTMSNSSFAGTAVVAGSKDHSFVNDQIDYTRLSQGYLQGNWKDQGFTAKIGRQTHFGGGVLGRFDGAYLSYNLTPASRIDAVAGAPVDLTRDGFMLRNRLFYGLSYNFKLSDPRWEASVFGIEQRADGALDRRAVGYDLRFNNKHLLVYNTVDYDVNFAALNAVILSGTYSFVNKSALGFDVDFRKSPSLFASNAVQGQGTDRLGSLLGRYDYSQIAQYAVDRSADSYTASLNYNRPLNDHLTVYSDLYETYIGPTAASAGVDAMPAEGPDTYATAELIANGLLRENDLYVGGARYGHSTTSNQYEIELGSKFPLNDKWRLSPEAKFGYKTFATDGHTEFHFLPSLGLNYAFSRNASLEMDAGGHMTESYASAGATRNWELLLTAGYRYDLYSQ